MSDSATGETRLLETIFGKRPFCPECFGMMSQDRDGIWCCRDRFGCGTMLAPGQPWPQADSQPAAGVTTTTTTGEGE